MFTKFIFIVLLLPILSHCWSYQTKCTKVFSNQLFDSSASSQHDIKKRNDDDDYYKKVPATSIFNIEKETGEEASLELKCEDQDEYIYLGQTQYGVSRDNESPSCTVKDGDCLVTVDYLANECNGMNNCSIQLDAQYLHSCKNYSNYLSIAYKCLSKATQVDVCSNKVLQNVDEFYLTTPNYPNEYNLNDCACNVEYMDAETSGKERLNLKFELLEFDVEDGESNVPVLCNKDRLTINEVKTNTSRKILCGQHKEFKEFNLITTAESNSLAINFTTDDSISRRGVLIKIKSINESKCPFNSKYYGNNKCIKLISKKYLNYKNANAFCKQLNGDLFQIQSFDDQLKLNSYYGNKNVDVWLKLAGELDFSLGISMKNNDAECLIKRNNGLVYDNCNKNAQFICEFNVQQPVNANKLRVACGQSRIKTPATTTTSTTTTTTPTPTTTTKIIKNELRNHIIQLEQQSTTTIKTPSKITIFNKNIDFVIIIGAVSGILIVIIIINIFFVWNYYNRKLKGLTSNNQKPTTTTKINKFLYPSSTTPITSSSNESTLNDFMYLQNKQAYFNIIHNSQEQQQVLIAPAHVYETIPSSQYCQTLSSHNSSNNYLIEPSYLNGYTTATTNRSGAIIVINGQNYYLTTNPSTTTCTTPIPNGLSPTQLSTCSSASSTRPLTSV